MKKILIVFCALALSTAAFGQNIAGTAHDFSTLGWSGGQICVACHTPHNADITVSNAPLWNHEVTTQVFTLYNTASLNATVGQPDGISKLCLSCHDGTVALDSYGGATGGTFLTGDADMGTSLADDHPISFTYDAALATSDGGLFDPSTTSSGLGGTITEDLLSAGNMECSSCHDVHDDTHGNFLVLANSGSALCLTCHDK